MPRALLNPTMILLIIAAPAAAQSMPSSAPASRPAESPQQALQRLYRQIATEFAAKDYAAAEKSCQAFLAVVPNHPDMLYNLACAQARLEKKDAAMATLEKAVAAGLSTGSHMEKDDDLATLRGEKKWGDLLAAVKENEKAGGPYEKGAEIKGVKTVEEKPEGGLPFRLRMSPAATAEKPNRLIVWLHPSGGSANRLVEAMAPELIEKGFALAVLPQKQFAGWTGEEAKKLVDKTLPAIGKVAGINADRPILMGFSAGGQMALELWDATPGRWGGLILDAAYPVAVEARKEARKYVLRPLPKDAEAIKKTPVFVLVGAKDGGAELWKQAQPVWKEAGVPLEVHTVEGAGHAWLFGAEQKKLLATWLEREGR